MHGFCFGLYPEVCSSPHHSHPPIPCSYGTRLHHRQRRSLHAATPTRVDRHVIPRTPPYEHLHRYLTPTSASGGNVFAGKLDARMTGDEAHAYVPNLAAQGCSYTFSDSSGVAQRLLGSFAAGRDEQEAAAIDALKVNAPAMMSLLPFVCAVIGPLLSW